MRHQIPDERGGVLLDIGLAADGATGLTATMEAMSDGFVMSACMSRCQGSRWLSLLETLVVAHQNSACSSPPVLPPPEIRAKLSVACAERVAFPRYRTRLQLRCVLPERTTTLSHTTETHSTGLSTSGDFCVYLRPTRTSLEIAKQQSRHHASHTRPMPSPSKRLLHQHFSWTCIDLASRIRRGREIFPFLAQNKNEDRKKRIDYNFVYDMCMAMTGHVGQGFFTSGKAPRTEKALIADGVLGSGVYYTLTE